MLSYRHGFHAGNYADVLKHYVLYSVLNYYNQKDKPYWYIDTHAGAGLYDVEDDFGTKTGEYKEGIGLLQKYYNDLSKGLQGFLDFVGQFSDGGRTLYPGSPLIAQKLVRTKDRIKLYELHPTDSELLIKNFKGQRVKYQISHDDGFQGLISILPPSTRRAITLMDPSYEEKADYHRVISTLEEAQKRFSTGCYILWYPLLPREESLSLPKKLMKKFNGNPEDYLNITLSVKEPSQNGLGMFGSGLFIINPPYTLKQELTEILSLLVPVLKKGDGANYTLT